MAEPTEESAAAPAKRLPPDERRRHLIDVALATFAERGYSDTELADIAEAAGIQRPLLYHYFGGKEDVYLVVLEHAWGELAAHFAVDPGHGSDLMPANMITYLDLVEARDPCVIVARQARHLDLPRVAETTRLASAAIARGMALNHLGGDEQTATAVAVFQAYLGLFEALIEEWTVGLLTRAQVETVIRETLPEIAAAAGRVAADSDG
jgi:AcrR family transcriptional regulator